MPAQFDSASISKIAPDVQSAIAPTPKLDSDELFGKLQTLLEKARAEYAARRVDKAGVLLEEMEKQLSESTGLTASRDDERDFALLEASLQTLRGRLLRRTAPTSIAFEKAYALFSKYADPIPNTPGRFARLTSLFTRSSDSAQSLDIRTYTDYGICLFRTYRNDDAIRVLGAVCKTGSVPAEALAYLGYAEMNRKEYGSAESRLRTALQLSPSDPTIAYWLGRNLRLQQKLHDAAVAFCDAGLSAYNLEDFCAAGRYGLWALRLEPASEQALRLAVAAYYNGNRRGLSLLIVEKYVQSQPANKSAAGWRGMLLRECGRLDESILRLQEIEVGEAKDSWILGELVLSLLAQGRGGAPEALAAAARAVELSPRDANLLRVQARVFVMRNEFAAAVNVLRQADGITPDREDVVIELADALINANDVAAAFALLSNAVTKFRSSAQAQYGLGFCYERQDMYEQAAVHYRRAIRLNPNYPQPLVQLLQLLIRQGLTDDALEEIEIQQSGPLSYIADTQRGILLAEGKHWGAALECFQRAVAAAQKADVLPHWPRLLLHLGDTLRQLGRYEEARQVYDAALDIGRNQVDVLRSLAGCHCDLAEFKKANEILDQAIKMPADDESHASLWLLKGWSLHHLGEFNQARCAYETAVELSKHSDPWSLKGLANVLMEFEPEQARKIFTDLLTQQKYQPNAEQITARVSPNSTLLGLIAWCNYRLGRYEEATRLYQSLVSQGEENVSEIFDLGLTLLAARRTEPAKQAYRRAFDISSKTETARLRGQYFVALFDLADALRHKLTDPAEAAPIMQELTRKLDASGIDVKQLSWLG